MRIAILAACGEGVCVCVCLSLSFCVSLCVELHWPLHFTMHYWEGACVAIGNGCPGQRGHGWCDVIGATTDARKYRFSVKERRKSLHVTKKPLIATT